MSKFCKPVSALTHSKGWSHIHVYTWRILGCYKFHQKCANCLKLNRWWKCMRLTTSSLCMLVQYSALHSLISYTVCWKMAHKCRRGCISPVVLHPGLSSGRIARCLCLSFPPCWFHGPPLDILHVRWNFRASCAVWTNLQLLSISASLGEKSIVWCEEQAQRRAQAKLGRNRWYIERKNINRPRWGG